MERAVDTRGQGLAVAGVLIVSVGVFAALARGYTQRERVGDVDRRLAHWLDGRTSPDLDGVVEGISIAGTPLFAAGAAVVGGIVLAAHRRFSAAALIAAAFAGVIALNAILKTLFDRDRPPVDEPGATASGSSFPSSHASVATALYGAVAIAVLTEVRSARVRKAIVAGAIVLVALVAATRLYLGAHYLSDVGAGIAAGVAWLAICLLALDAARYVGERRRTLTGTGPRSP